MNPGGHGLDAGERQPIRWKHGREELVWSPEQLNGVRNLLGAIKDGAESRRRKEKTSASVSARRGRRQAAAIGFASLGLGNPEDGWRSSSKQSWGPAAEDGSSHAEASSSHPGFARLAGALSKRKRDKVEKIEEDVKDAAREAKDLAKETAKDLRVPVVKTKVPGVGEIRSITLKQLICGIISGGFAGVASTPFAIWRTRVVAKKGGESSPEVLRNLAQQEGLQTLFKGSLLVATFTSALQKGFQFATYEAVKKIEEKRGQDDPRWLPLPRAIPISTVAGAAAGVVSTLVTYPFSVLLDRTVLEPAVYSSMTGAVATILREEGVAGLYRGITPALLSMVPASAAAFYTYEALKQRWKERRAPGEEDLPLVPSLLVGALAGAFSSTLTYPVEMARKQVSMGALPRSATGPNVGYANMMHALQRIAGREGFRGLYRGITVEWMQTIPYTAVSFAAYEMAKRILVAEGEESRDEVKDAPPDASVP